MTEQTEEKKGFIARHKIALGLMAVMFLLGFVSMGWPYWQASGELSKTKTELQETKNALTREKISNLLMTAIVESGTGNFKTALENASEFFTSIRNEIDLGEQGAFTEEETKAIKQILADRDAIIADLAVKDESGTRRLLRIYEIYHRATGRENIGSYTDLNTGEDSNKNTSANVQNEQTGETNTNINGSNVNENEPAPASEPEKPAAGANSNSNRTPVKETGNRNSNQGAL